MAAVRVENLHFRYPVFDPDATGVGGEEPGYALAGIELEIAEGELLGISGTTGSGKTTLCLALNGLVPQQTSGTIRGDVWIGDWNTKRVPVPQLATRVGLVFQDPEANLLGLTVEDEVAFGPENLAVEPREIEERVGWALDVVGMSAFRRRPAALLSGGQKQRVGIAAVLAMLPQVLVLDEPTAELDPIGKREITDVISGLRERERGMTVVMVESDAATLARLADRLAIMDAGAIVALDEPRALYSHPAPLIERGVPVPDVSEVALLLNRRLGTDWSFVTHDEAMAALANDLRATSR
ncbi:MAG TPA: ATP-binding cassette domain-containing protein [Thermomicrobiales bacterium]|nr:ATP-binding cassette domain-containing protein [Thermomicrobiales bacterium]